MEKLHLICNAHMDPVWLWEWEEGAASAISTFRSAADLADSFDYIFCHNEAILYKWVQEFDPRLFERIKTLVAEGKWHIMGGWYLQPDCNMPSGESLIRQAMCGKKYFFENFGKIPATAMNVDPFGHSAGLVQVLAKCGYDSYLFCRPYPSELEMEDRFIWKGPDGSEVKCFRAGDAYHSSMGGAAEKIKRYIENNPDLETGLLLWGVGNHGGGPSRKDLSDIEDMIKSSELKIVHSTLEAYFKESRICKTICEKSLNPCMIGCYSSQVRIKQKYRLLENAYYSTEKMCSCANAQNLMKYPFKELEEAQNDLMYSQFHDILPGSGIKEAENAGLRLMEHGLEILSRIRFRAFYSLCSGQKKTNPGEYTIFVYNPHPYEIRSAVECEFQLEDQNWSEDFTTVNVYGEGKMLPSQIIKESSNLNLDWRKKILFDCVLSPSSMNRFDCGVQRTSFKPEILPVAGPVVIKSKNAEIRVNQNTGLIDMLEYKGRQFLGVNAFMPFVTEDSEDSYASNEKQKRSLGRRLDCFKLLDDDASSKFMGLEKAIPAVRVIEDGAVATVVEAVFAYGFSYLVANYIFYKNHDEIEIKYAVFWNEKNKALKISIPTTCKGAYLGETVFGTEILPQNGDESCMQKWSMISDPAGAFGILNKGTYSSSCNAGEVCLTLLRSPCYAALAIPNRPIVRNDRFLPHTDQGEHQFRFRFLFGEKDEISRRIGYEAQIFNEAPYALNVFPSGEGRLASSVINISNPCILLVALKKSGDTRFIIRLFNCCGNSEETILSLPMAKIRRSIEFGKFEVKTFQWEGSELTECAMMEI